jgi:transposase
MLFWWLAGESWMVLRDVISDDEAWAVIGPLFPKVKATGRPPVDRLTVVDAAAWRLRTGAPWRDVPERFGSWNTIYRSLNRWAEDGVWARVLEMPQVPGSPGRRPRFGCVDRLHYRASTSTARLSRGPRGFYRTTTSSVRSRVIMRSDVAWRADDQEPSGLRRAQQGARVHP